MWADNETEVDLLGFDFLVDTLFVALTEPRLLPLTVGLLGDWGSGKSSLMRITRQELLKIRDDEESPQLRQQRRRQVLDLTLNRIEILRTRQYGHERSRQ